MRLNEELVNQSILDFKFLNHLIGEVLDDPS